MQLGFNADAIQFLIDKDIDYKGILNSDEGKLLRTEDINYIVSRYGMYYSAEKTYISVADILGRCDVKLGTNILSTMASHFDSQGGGYEQRSISMLEYSNGEEMIEGLKDSFKSEPMRVSEAEKGKYIMGSNGMHRFTLLRIHYLNELLNGNISQAELKEKYRIPVELSEINYFRTYSDYILNQFGKDTIGIWNKYEEDGRISENVELKFKNGTSEIMSESEVKKVVESTLSTLNEHEIKTIKYNYELYPSFKEYIDTNFAEFSEKLAGIDLYETW